MAEGAHDSCQKSSKIARFIPKPQKVAPKKTDPIYAATSDHVDPQLQWRPSPRDGTPENRRRNLKIGDRVLISGTRYGTLRYLGETQFSDGIWCGVELDEPSGGKHSGVVNGIQYFACRPNYGIFAPVTKVELVPSFEHKSYLPELSYPSEAQTGGASVKNKVPSFLSRLPKLGIASKNSGNYCAKESGENSGSRSADHCRSCDDWNDHNCAVHRASFSGVRGAGNLGGRDTSAPSGSYCQDDPRYEASRELNTATQLSPPTSDQFSPMHDEWETEEVSNGEEATGAEYLSPIREAADFSREGILRSSAMTFVPKTFSTDDVADLPEEEEYTGAVGGAVPSSDVPTFISSEVLRILRYNFPDLVDNLNSVIARNKASLAEEFRDIPLASRPSEPQPEAVSKVSTVDSGDYSSGLATSIGSVECELATHTANELTEVNLSVLHDDDDSHVKRPASVYTVQSTDTGFQGDSELDCEAAISPCEDKTMRWSTCSSQDSGAVSESGSEFQRRNLHLHCCTESYNPSDRQCRRLPLLQAPDEDIPGSSDEAQHQQEESPGICKEENEVVSEERSEQDVAEPVSPSKKTTADTAKKKRPAPKVVVSKIKAMIEASSSKLESETAAVTKRQPKKNKWDAVTSRIQASMADEKAKPKVREIKSKVFSNLEAAKQQPKQTQVQRRPLPSSASSRASTKTECDNTASEHGRSDSRRESIPSPTGDGSTASTKNDAVECVTTVNVGGPSRSGELESAPSEKGTAEKKAKGPIKRPDYPRPWMVSKTQTKEAQNEASTPLSKRTLTSQQKACMPKSVHFSTSVGQTEPKKAFSTLKPPQSRAKADTRVGHPLTKAEFTKEIQRLGALCEARTKEANFLKLQLKHASAGFAAFSVLLRHLTEQHEVFSIPHLTEELQKSRQEIDRAHVAIEQYKVDIEDLKQKQLEDIEAMKAEITRKHAAQLEELEAARKSELAFCAESNMKKTEELKSFYSGIIEGDRKSHDATIDALKQKQKEKIEAINEEYTIQLDAINEEHAAEQAQLEAKHSALMDQYRALQEQAREFQSSVLLDTDAKIQWLSKKNADLQKEVDSLNVVLEMRAEQIQALQRSKLEMERKEEELERCKDRIQKLEARNEDLQELLNEKVKLQSQLSVENAVLRENSEMQHRQLSRLDMHNEELKYKLRESSNQSFTYERGSTKPRPNPPKRFSVADPTVMSRSWHSERSRVTGAATRKTFRSHQRSQTLPHNGQKAGMHPDNRKVRRSMSDSVPIDESVRKRLFSPDQDGSFERHQRSDDELLRLTWVSSPEDTSNVPCKGLPNPQRSSSSESGGSLPDQAYHDGLSDGSSSVEGADVTLHASPILRESSPRDQAGEAMILDEVSTAATVVENNLT